MHNIDEKAVTENTLYFTKNALKMSGWTEGMIKDLLGEADFIKDHVWYGWSNGEAFTHVPSRGRYYLDSRVKSVEQTDEFKKRLAKSKSRWAKMRMEEIHLRDLTES